MSKEICNLFSKKAVTDKKLCLEGLQFLKKQFFHPVAGLPEIFVQSYENPKQSHTLQPGQSNAPVKRMP